jgi:hypothetical protein
MMAWEKIRVGNRAKASSRFFIGMFRGAPSYKKPINLKRLNFYA